jgi:hypothetical protein
MAVSFPSPDRLFTRSRPGNQVLTCGEAPGREDGSGDPSLRSAFTFFTPIFGVLLGGLLLQEPLTLKLLTGGGLVTVGMILVNWPDRQG